jgi:pimeloyl-ACP methyl ester carboxylesterase
VYGEGAIHAVFVPPWSIVHARIYKAQVPWLSDRLRCVTYDARGNGKSDRPARPEDYTVEHSVADALAVLDATGTEAAVLVGMSLGGGLSAMLAAHHPERVRAAVLLGTTATIGPGYPYHSPAHFTGPRDNFDGWNKYHREYWLRVTPISPSSSNVFRPALRKQLEDGLDGRPDHGRTLVHTVAAILRARLRPERAMCRAIRCPMLVVTARTTASTDRARARWRRSPAGFVGNRHAPQSALSGAHQRADRGLPRGASASRRRCIPGAAPPRREHRRCTSPDRAGA